MPYRISFSAAELGFDPRADDKEVDYPESAGDGPVILVIDERSGWSQSLNCRDRADALNQLKRYGYRVRVR